MRTKDRGLVLAFLFWNIVFVLQCVLFEFLLSQYISDDTSDIIRPLLQGIGLKLFDSGGWVNAVD